MNPYVSLWLGVLLGAIGGTLLFLPLLLRERRKSLASDARRALGTFRADYQRLKRLERAARRLAHHARREMRVVSLWRELDTHLDPNADIARQARK